MGKEGGVREIGDRDESGVRGMRKGGEVWDECGEMDELAWGREW